MTSIIEFSLDTNWSVLFVNLLGQCPEVMAHVWKEQRQLGEGQYLYEVHSEKSARWASHNTRMCKVFSEFIVDADQWQTSWISLKVA